MGKYSVKGTVKPRALDLRQATMYRATSAPRLREKVLSFCKNRRAPPSLYGIPQEELAGRGRGRREATTVFVSQDYIVFVVSMLTLLLTDQIQLFLR